MTAAYIDDIIIGGSTLEECHENVLKVMKRLDEFNVKANRAKCIFYKQEVEFLGHVLNGEGVKPMKCKLEEIAKAKRPWDVTSLKAYLGLLNYYGKFVKNLSSRLAPLYTLLKNDVPFVWTDEMENVFRDNGFPPQHILNREGSFKKYDKFKNAFSVDNGVVYLGHRVVVPKNLREKVLKLIHEGHDGVVRMKSIARGCVWWPDIEAHIEQTVRMCEACQVIAPKPRNVSLTRWTDTSYPYERIHIDFFFWNSMIFLIIVDDFSKFIDVKYLKKSDVWSTIEALQSNFAIFGLPKKLVSDNGSPFQSKEFAQFCSANRILHVTSPPYHPMSNGAAERAVQTVKKSLKKFVMDEEKKKMFNNTPSTITGVDPNSLIFNHKVRTHLSLLGNERENEKENEKERKVVRKSKKNLSSDHPEKTQMMAGAKKKPMQPLQVNQEIWYFDALGRRWTRGKIEKQLSKTVFILDLQGTLKKAHADQIKPYVRRVPIATAAATSPQPRASPSGSPEASDEEFKTPPEAPPQPTCRRRRKRETQGTPVIRRSERLRKTLKF
uniref:RNA-directed DNA polymerase n=1 Tax=Lutzomyia longipalpis TaxID=7200 RepID=A0A1B0GGX2_LUTLO